MKHLFAFCAIIAIATFARAQEVTTPAAGTPERKAIMDALRKPVEKTLKMKVIFKVYTVSVLGEWAFLFGQPQQPSGKKIDYSKTVYRDAVSEGMFDDGVSALLQKKNDEWKVVTYNIGATDVPWVDWPEKFNVPTVLFKR